MTIEAKRQHLQDRFEDMLDYHDMVPSMLIDAGGRVPGMCEDFQDRGPDKIVLTILTDMTNNLALQSYVD